MDGFPCSAYAPLELRKPPVTAVTFVKYIDMNGVEQTWDASNYTTDLPTGSWAARGRIVPAYGLTWPTTRTVMNAVTVRIACGYTAAPEAIKAAMKLLIGHWFKNREAVNAPALAPVPHAVDALLWPFKAF